MFVTLPIETDPDVLVDQALDRLAATFPGFVPREGHLEVVLLEEFARIAAETATVAAQVPAAIFREFGRRLIGLEPIEGSPAYAETTWVMQDTAGYTIPAGTVVLFAVTGDERVEFETMADTVIPPGQDTADGVLVRSLDIGEHANGFAPGPVQLFDALTYVTSVEATTVTTGGVAPETDAAYLDRLAQELTLLAPRPILPDDFAILARRVAGVHRALALDGYDPDSDTFGHERMVTLALVDQAGAPVTSETAGEVSRQLDDAREVNFVVHTIDPTYTPVQVQFTAVAAAGADPAAARADAIAAVRGYLDPARWAGGAESPPAWRPGRGTVHHLELAAIIGAADGIAYVTGLTLNGDTADVDLDGRAPLPAPVGAGTVIDGTVVAP